MTTNARAAEIIAAVRKSHIAVLGKTGSGKTSTEKLIVEAAVAGSFRVCVLDTIKSDWWGITSSASGKSPGLPFKILGGPRGHVPLHSSAGKVIGQLVGSGKLPLSIIDMADFEPGGIQRFFVDFAESLWRNVRGVVVLVIEEAHEIAPKEQAGFGKENMSIYWAKKIATGSRTKGIRLIVATQRTQALHNAVLGSVETMIAHRMTLDADQEQVRKWLKNTNKALVAEVNDSLNSLLDGMSWVCSGEAKIFEKLHWPKFKTYDNTATPDSDGPDVHVKTAPVNQDELREIIGEAVKIAEQNDVPTLRRRIAELEKEKRAAPDPDAAPSVAAVQAAEQVGFERGKEAVLKEARRVGQEVVTSAMSDMQKLVNDATAGIAAAVAPLKEAVYAGVKTAQVGFPDVSGNVKFESGLATVAQTPVAAPRRAPLRERATPPPAPRSGGSISGPEQKIIDAIRWWNVMGVSTPTHAQVGSIARYSHKSGTWARYLSSLRSAGLVEPRGDLILTMDGLEAAAEPAAPPTREALWEAVLEQLDGPLQKIMRPIIAAYPAGVAHATIATEANYSHKSGTWARYLSALRSRELIEKRGDLRAQAWLFP